MVKQEVVKKNCLNMFSLCDYLLRNRERSLSVTFPPVGWRVLNEDCELIVNANCVGASSPSAAHNLMQEIYGAPKNEKVVTPTMVMYSYCQTGTFCGNCHFQVSGFPESEIFTLNLIASLTFPSQATVTGRDAIKD